MAVRAASLFVDVTARTRNLDRALGQAESRAQRFERTANRSGTVTLDADTSKFERKLQRATGMLGALPKQHTTTLYADMSPMERKLRQAQGELAAFPESKKVKVEADTDRFQKGIGGANRSVIGFNRSMMTMRNVQRALMVPAIVTAVGVLSAGLAAAGAAAVALTAALAPLAGTMAAFPTLLSAVGQAAGTAKLAFIGMGDAMKDTKKALEAPTPAAKRFAGVIKANVIPGVVRLRDTAQGNLFGGLERAIRIVSPLLGAVRPVVAATARTLGNLAVAGARLAASWKGDLLAVGNRNVGLMKILGGAALRLANAFRNVLVAAGPLVTWLAKGVASWAAWVDRTMEAARASGRLAGFFGQTRQTISVLVAIGKNLASVFASIGKAALPLGMDLLRSFAGVTRQWATFLGSVKGQKALTDFFNRARPVIYEAARLVGALATAFAQISFSPEASKGITNLMAQIRTQLLPVLATMVASTTAAFGPHLVKALVEIAKLFTTLAGTSGPLTLWVDAIAQGAKVLNFLLGAVPGMQGFLITMMGLNTVLKITGLSMALLRPSALIAGFSALTGVVGSTTTGFRAMAAGTGVATAAQEGNTVATYAGAVAQKAWAGAARVATGAAAALTAAEAAAAAAARAHPFIAAATALILLGTAFVVAYKKSETFRNAVNKYGPILLALISPLAAVGIAVVRLVNRFQWMQTTLKAIWMAMKATATAIFGAIKAVVLALVGSMIGAVVARVRGFANTVKGIWGAMRTTASTSWGLIKAAIIQPVGSAVGWATRKFSDFAKFLSGLWGRIKDGARTGWEGISKAIVDAFGSVKRGIQRAWDWIAEKLNKAIPFGNPVPHFAGGGVVNPSKGGPAGGGVAEGAGGRTLALARGGKVTRPTAIVGEEAPRHPEYVIATNPKYRSRNKKLAANAASAVGLKVDGYAKGGQLGGGREKPVGGPEGEPLFPKGQRIMAGILPGLAKGGTVLAKLISEANKIAAKHYPYRWGGGHDMGFTPPYDCSGAVSAILHAAGLLAAPRTSGGLMGFGGAKGPGAATIYANPGHVFMSLNGRGWGTGKSNPGGGAGWLPYSSRGGFEVSHITGVGGAAGAVPGGGGGGLAVMPNLSGAMKFLPEWLRPNLGKALTGWIGKAWNSVWGLFGDQGDQTYANFKGPWHDVMRQIAQAKKWDLSDWEWLVAAESSGDPNARNPKSGAYGLGQFLGSTLRAYAKYGAASSNPTDQIRAMAKYISDRYGTPSAAKAFHLGHNWYAEGGILGFAKGGKVDPHPGVTAMGSLWKAAKRFYPGAGKMPPWKRRGGYGGEFIAGDTPAKDIIQLGNTVVGDLVAQNPAYRASAVEVLLHEWAHYYQKGVLTRKGDDTAFREGGADLFALQVLKRLPRNLAGQGTTAGGYPRERAMLQKKLGKGWLGWVMHDQFTGGRLLAKGGVLGYAAGTPDAFGKTGGAKAPKALASKAKPKKRGKPFDALQLFGMWGRSQTTEVPTSIRNAVQRFTDQAGFAGEMADRAGTLGSPGFTFDEIAKKQVWNPGAMVGGMNELDWLKTQLGALGALRNQLVQAYQAAMQRRAMLSKMLEQLQAQLKKLQEERKDLLARVKRQEKTLAAAKKQVPSKLLPRDRRRQAAVTAAQAALDQTKARLTNVNETLGGMPRAIGDVRKRRDGLAASAQGSKDTLAEVQGAYGPITLMPRLPEIGALGGSIFQAQARIADLSKPAETAQDVSTGVADTGVTEQMNELLREQLRVEKLRTAVSERQFATLRALPPFGGSFAAGGVVPGPAGAARTAIVHGGETITPAGQGTVTVVVNGDITNVPAGKDPVEVVLNDRRFAVAVERATRPAGRSADRRLPSSRAGF